MPFYTFVVVIVVATSEIEWCLKSLSYPANESIAISPSKPPSPDSKNETQMLEQMFKKLAKHMLEVESPSFHTTTTTDSIDNVVFGHDSSRLVESTLIQLLIQPLEKRFKFHFCTQRKTNNLDKACINQ